MFVPYLALIWPIGAESLAYSETSQLRLEVSLIDSVYVYKLCNTSPDN